MGVFRSGRILKTTERVSVSLNHSYIFRGSTSGTTAGQANTDNRTYETAIPKTCPRNCAQESEELSERFPYFPAPRAYVCVVCTSPRTVTRDGHSPVRLMTSVEATWNVRGIASQVKSCMTDMQAGTRAHVAMAALSLRVLVGESSGRVRVLV
jgi:hypothetical protein